MDQSFHFLILSGRRNQLIYIYLSACCNRQLDAAAVPCFLCVRVFILHQETEGIDAAFRNRNGLSQLCHIVFFSGKFQIVLTVILVEIFCINLGSSACGNAPSFSISCAEAVIGNQRILVFSRLFRRRKDYLQFSIF